MLTFPFVLGGTHGSLTFLSILQAEALTAFVLVYLFKDVFSSELPWKIEIASLSWAEAGLFFLCVLSNKDDVSPWNTDQTGLLANKLLKIWFSKAWGLSAVMQNPLHKVAPSWVKLCVVPHGTRGTGQEESMQTWSSSCLTCWVMRSFVWVSGLLPESMKLWQDNLLACKKNKS